MLAHDACASLSPPGFAPSSPKNKSWRSVPIARGSMKRQYTDTPAQKMNPQMIASRRRFQPSPCSRVSSAYAAARRRTPGMSRTKASQARRPALNEPTGPITLRTTAMIQRRFVAKRRADAAVSRAAESPGHRGGRSPFANPSFTSWGLGTRGRLVKGFCDPFVLSRRPLHRAGARTERREVGDSLLGREGGGRSDRTSAVRRFYRRVGGGRWVACGCSSCLVELPRSQDGSDLPEV